LPKSPELKSNRVIRRSGDRKSEEEAIEDNIVKKF